ncbi:MAG TPA: hypothetical protein PLO20_02520 [Thermogutta sp.]|nr:hypothetical protein [Thermogutta sp.]
MFLASSFDSRITRSLRWVRHSDRRDGQAEKVGLRRKPLASDHDPHRRGISHQTPKSYGVGFTLVEMLAAVALTGLIVVGIVAFAQLAEDSFATGQDSSETIQIARTCFQQIESMLNAAWGNELFPGALVVPRLVSGTQFPEALVIWCPVTGQPRNPDGLPCVDELVVLSPDSSRPHELRKYRVSNNSATVPSPSNVSAWQSLIHGIQSQSPAQSQLLTDRLRTFTVNNVTLGAIRFRVETVPSDSEWADSSVTWSTLSWPQGLYGPNRGVRRVSVHTEIQLRKKTGSLTPQPEASCSFWHSHAYLYTVRKEKRLQ